MKEADRGPHLGDGEELVLGDIAADKDAGGLSQRGVSVARCFLAVQRRGQLAVSRGYRPGREQVRSGVTDDADRVDELAEDGRYRLRLVNGVLTYTTAKQAHAADVSLRMPRLALPALLVGAGSMSELADLGIRVDGDADALWRLMSVLDAPDPDFAIVTP